MRHSQSNMVSDHGHDKCPLVRQNVNSDRRLWFLNSITNQCIYQDSNGSWGSGAGPSFHCTGLPVVNISAIGTELSTFGVVNTDTGSIQTHSTPWEPLLSRWQPRSMFMAQVPSRQNHITNPTSVRKPIPCCERSNLRSVCARDCRVSN